MILIDIVNLAWLFPIEQNVVSGSFGQIIGEGSGPSAGTKECDFHTNKIRLLPSSFTDLLKKIHPEERACM